MIKGIVKSLLRATLLLSLAGAAFGADCGTGPLAVVVNRGNPTESLSMAQLRKLLIGDVHSWPDRKKVILVDRDPGSAVHRCVLSAVVRMSESEYRRYLMNAEFRGEEPLPSRMAESGSAAGKAVSGSAGSFSVVEAAALPALGDSVKVVRINGKQPGEPGYPLT
jgi:ABC-type phosphate transport system substrate-binding protein